MTLDELLSRARATMSRSDYCRTDSERELASGVIDLLGEDPPCGWEPVRVSDTGAVDGHPTYTPDEVRAHAVALLRAADEADEMIERARIRSEIRRAP